MKKITLLLLSAISTLYVWAQKDEKEYRQHSEEIRQEIWNNADPGFKVKIIPDNLKNESGVIIASNFSVVNSSKFKIKFNLMNSTQRVSYQTTVHERVMINDKVALEDFSTLEYTKKLDRSFSYAFTKVLNKQNTYIGAKIIKPDNKEIIVNTDEEVLTTNKDKAKEGKLAISDLQVGDILDYFVRVETVQEYNSEIQGPYTFIMGGEYPTLSYTARLQLDDKVGVECISANGAPRFRQSETDDKDMLLELSQKNLPKIETKLWSSVYRQYPYIRLQFKYMSAKEDAYSHFNRGEVNTDDLAAYFIKEFGRQLKSVEYNSYASAMNDYFGGSKKIKDFSSDTIVKTLYNVWRYQTFADLGKNGIDVGNDNNYRYASSLYNTLLMAGALNDYNIDFNIYLVCSKYTSSLKDVMNISDLDAVMEVNADGKKYWMAFDDMMTQFNEIPARFQGEPATVLQVEHAKRSNDLTETTGKLPVTSASQNTTAEKMTVEFDPGNLQLLRINRSAVETGYLRIDDQKLLIMLEDWETEISRAVQKDRFVERMADVKKTKNTVTEYQAAFAKERKSEPDYFKKEIDNEFDVEPKDLISYKVVNNGLSKNKPPFEYNSVFTMENFVKKAGNNYIMEVGRLAGSFSKVEDKDTNRLIDIYMPCARTFIYDIKVIIPAGYTVKGVSDLNKSLTNDCGSFSCKADVSDNALNIHISRTYNKAFEPVVNWPKLVQIINAFYTLTTQKILLEKNK